jgi:hypothetical protein
MKSYIGGYYCRDDLHLQIMNKESNRKILEALKDAYPIGLTVEELAKKTKLPIKTIYAQKAELYREFYISHEMQKEEELKAKRGRPSVAIRQQAVEGPRKRVRIIPEDAAGPHDPYEGKKPVPLPPGNVVYSNGFIEAWDNIVGKDEEEQLCKDLLQFIERVFNRLNIYEEPDDDIRKRWAPEKTVEFCCSQCGLNHEARDFIRAILIRLIDQLETSGDFIDFLKNKELLTQDAYDKIKAEHK